MRHISWITWVYLVTGVSLASLGFGLVADVFPDWLALLSGSSFAVGLVLLYAMFGKFSDKESLVR